MELNEEMIKTLKEELEENGMFPCDSATVYMEPYQYFLDKTKLYCIDFVNGDKQQKVTLRPDIEWDTEKIQEQLNNVFVKKEVK